MSEPITWRTITGRSPAEASRPLDAAGESFNRMFAPLQEILKQREATDANNAQVTQDTAKAGLLEALHGLKTPEQVQAFDPSQYTAGMTPKSRMDVLNAPDQRVSALQQQTTAENAFKDMVRNHAEEPAFRQGQAIAATGDAAALADWQARNPGHSRTADIINAYNTRVQQAQKSGDDHAVAEQNVIASKELGKYHNAELDSKNSYQNSMLGYRGQEIAAQQATARAAAAQQQIQNAIKLAEEQRKAVELLGKGEPGTGNGNGSQSSAHIDSFLKTAVPDDTKRAIVAQVYGKIVSDPQNQHMTPQEMLGIALKTADTRSPWHFWGGKPPDLETALSEFRANPVYAERVQNAQNVRQLQLDGVNRILGQLKPSGSTAPADAIASAIYAQESGSGSADTSKVNSQGVTGPMQVQRNTFDGMKKMGLIPESYDFSNPAQTKEAGDKWVGYLTNKYQGDPAKVAAAYYGGEGAVNVDGSINRDWKNKQRPGDPTVGEYVDQVVKRLPPTVAQASAAIRNTAPAPSSTVVAPPTTPEQALKQSLPSYNGQPVNNSGLLDGASKSVSNFLDKIGKSSEKNNAQVAAITIKDLLDNGRQVSPEVLGAAQDAAKKYPEMFDPKVLDWVGQTQAQKKSPELTTQSEGAFSVPKDAKPDTTHATLDIGTGATATAKAPVEIPNVAWTKPTTVVQADSSNQSKGVTPKTVVTFVPEQAKVTHVSDGDTVQLQRANGAPINCRIDNINAPELAHPGKSNKPAQPFGEEAKKTLEELIANKQVTLRVSREATAGGSNYGRAACQIEIEGKDVSAEMIKSGMAWLYRKYSNDPALSAAEDKAKKDKVGLWGGLNPINPSDFLHMNYR